MLPRETLTQTWDEAAMRPFPQERTARCPRAAMRRSRADRRQAPFAKTP